MNGRSTLPTAQRRPADNGTAIVQATPAEVYEQCATGRQGLRDAQMPAFQVMPALSDDEYLALREDVSLASRR